MRRRRRWLALARQPALECVRLHGDDIERHQRMGQPAELGTLAPKHARPDRTHRKLVGSAGDHVHLAREPGDPKTVDHVGPAQPEQYRAPDRNTDLVRGRDRIPAGWHIADAPPELLAGDVNPQVGGSHLARAHDRQAVAEQAQQQHRR